MLLLTSNGVVSGEGVVTALVLATSECAEAERSSGKIGWPRSWLRLEGWSVICPGDKPIYILPKMAMLVWWGE